MLEGLRSRLSRFARWLSYRAVSAAVHQPLALRGLATFIRTTPRARGLLSTVASREDVVGVFQRPSAFSSSAHRPNLVAGEFAIGMESDARHACERAQLLRHLPSPTVFAARASAESQRLIAALRAGGSRRFDLIDDYMVPIVWQALGGSFGQALPALSPGDPMFLNLRYVGAHLIAGATATDAVQRRARESAAALNAWVRGQLPALQALWQMPAQAQREAVARNVIGMLWVGHPATVQSGALMMQELLARPEVLHALAGRVRQSTDPWGDAPLRELLARHVLELLRFRPPFPILRRDVPRDVLYGADGKAVARAGAQLTLMVIGALFDPAAHGGADPTRYDPDRAPSHPDDRYLVFGAAQRQCIAPDQVVETLVSALTGLLLLPQLRWAQPWWRRMRYDGPIIASAPLSFRATAGGRDGA
ncbi:MAG: cytochrome P450 [Comamonadaceae bacterium]|nr:MAG: cytochrome P450 [Comamonadaceae bacterium]